MNKSVPELPKSIRIAHTDFRVEHLDHRQASARNHWGELSCTEMVIRIETVDRNHADVLCTLIHEINHAIYWAYNLEDDDKQERICGVIATGWTQVYRDNPHLVRFLVESAQSSRTSVQIETPQRISERHITPTN